MNKKKIILGAAITLLGAVGIASLLTTNIPVPPEAEAILTAKKFTDQQIQLLLLVNPAIMLVVAAMAGTILYQKVKFKIPLIEKALGIESDTPNVSEILKYGILGGLLSGLLLILVSVVFHLMTPEVFEGISKPFRPTLASKLLYGGLTEEILMRFGLMTFIVWVTSKIVRGTTPVVYWTGIVVAAVIFAFGHFPMARGVVENPSTGLLTYIFLGNTTGGIIFGWLYWKKGLESAFVAHLFAHVVMLIARPGF